MTHLAKVHTLYERNCRSIPDMLREAAGNIETEKQEGFSPTKAMVAVQISESGQIQIHGWGDTDILHSIACLDIGKQMLVNMQMEDSE